MNSYNRDLGFLAIWTLDMYAKNGVSFSNSLSRCDIRVEKDGCIIQMLHLKFKPNDMDLKVKQFRRYEHFGARCLETQKTEVKCNSKSSIKNKISLKYALIFW